MRRTQWIGRIMVVLVLVTLPIAGAWFRKIGPAACALDGMRIDPFFRIRIIEANDSSRQFCCIRCAERWLDRQQSTRHQIYLTDEATGEEIDLGAAIFVRSSVVTMPTTGNSIHVFQSPKEAKKHARECHGTILEKHEKPFHRLMPDAANPE